MRTGDMQRIIKRDRGGSKNGDGEGGKSLGETWGLAWNTGG